jgi:diketogulonate reductase-like aldo/keto reductase
LTQSGGLLEKLAKKYGKTPAQIAINWLTSQDNVIAIAKTSISTHLEENLGAVGWALETTDIEELRKEFPSQVQRPENLPLR